MEYFDDTINQINIEFKFDVLYFANNFIFSIYTYKKPNKIVKHIQLG